MIIRNFKESDLNEVTALFYDTVHTINAKDYSCEQVNAWAPHQLNLSEWNQSLLNNYSLVVIEKDQIVGFGDIDETGYLNRLYVHKEYQGRGIATEICNELENHVVVSRVKVHASITAKPFFEKRGYKILNEQQVERGGIVFINYEMEKSLTA